MDIVNRLAVMKNMRRLVTDARYQTILNSRIERCLVTSFGRPGGPAVSTVWDGGYTVVVLDWAGTILAFSVKRKGPIYERYGDLLPYAMKKAIFRFHLELAHADGGLDSEGNLSYLRSLLPGETIFLGEAETSFMQGMPIIIGVSGAPLASKYRQKLAPMLPEVVEFVAGAADQVFAELIGKIPGDAAFPIVDEPDVFAWLRRAH